MMPGDPTEPPPDHDDEFATTAKTGVRNVVDALGQALAEAQAELAELRKQKNAEDSYVAFLGLLKMLRASADESLAKNHATVSFHWDPAIMPQLPFHRVECVFFRDGGKSPSELVAMAKHDLGVVRSFVREGILPMLGVLTDEQRRDPRVETAFGYLRDTFPDYELPQ